MAERWVTFDCYGTLIDWNRGIGDALHRLWPEADRAALLRSYHKAEPQVQAGGARPYREVLGLCTERIAATLELPPVAGAETALADSLPTWPPFPEVPGALQELRSAGWRLGILSNTDPDLLDASLRTIDVEVDVRITAAEAGGYKPNFAHWDTFFRTTMADRERHVHVAASLFHDVEPCAKLGLPCVWINRLGESSDLPRAGELPNLAPLPATLDALVPG